MRDRPVMLWAGAAVAVVGLLMPWADWPRTVFGAALVWELLLDRAAYDLVLAGLAAVAVVGLVATVTAAWRRGPRSLIAAAAVGTATLPVVVILHELWTHGFTFWALGAGVPVELAAAILLGVAAVRYTPPEHQPTPSPADDADTRTGPP